MREQIIPASKLLERGDVAQAKKILQSELKSHPKDSDCLHLLGVIANKEKDFKLATTLISQAVSLRGNNPYYHFNLAVSLKAQNELEKALECYTKCIHLSPKLAQAHLNKGIVLKQLHKIDEAIESHTTAINLNDKLFLAFLNRGLAYQVKRHLNLAITDFVTAINIKPDYAEAYANLANIHRELKNYALAIECYEKALRLNSSLPYLQGLLLHSKMCVADWQSFDSQLDQLKTDVYAHKRVSPSFPLLALVDDPLAHLRCSQTWMSHNNPVKDTLGPLSAISQATQTNRRVRLAYISPDFRDHPVAYLMAQVFELHNKEQFELFAFCLSPCIDDQMHKRISNAFEHFIYVNNLSDKDIAQLCRDMSIDIAVDLSGLTEGSRPGIYAYRAAPLQLGYLGYLGTMGASYFDYIVADSSTVISQNRAFFTEKVLSLACYQANDQLRKPSNIAISKIDLGIAEDAFVFCCLNNTYKITPSTFESWARILSNVPQSVLLLLAENSSAKMNLQNSAILYGIEPSRLIFCNRVERPEYLARFKAADLFLDTLPYNAGTTASDALWAGLPVLTLAGNSFAARIGASLLNALGLPELITYSKNEYEDKAVELAMNDKMLLLIKNKLFQNSSDKPLFDSVKFTQSIEKGFIQIIERHSANLPPTDIFVTD